MLALTPGPLGHKSSVELPDDEESMDEFDNSEMLEGLDGERRFIMFMQPFELGTCCSIVVPLALNRLLLLLLLLLELLLLRDEVADVDDTSDWDFSESEARSDEVAGTREINEGPPPTRTPPSKLLGCFRFSCCCCCCC